MSQDDLFQPPPRVAKFPEERPFQGVTLRELRAGVGAGHQRQIVMAPTGAGKTYLALRLCMSTLEKGNRVLFICDRKTLINQTSAVADGYGMPPHGIIQADNPRFALYRPFQIASAQTIAARGLTDDFQVIIVDECHTLHDSTTELIAETKAAVVGLSATPFTKGLGKMYSRVINAATMDELTKSGVLTPFRVVSTVRADMKGAATSGGEWTQKAAGDRGMKILGDVVKEWLEHANNAKTIVFGSNIAHCEALRAQFAAAGVRAELFTKDTKDNERKDLLDEYRKPDSRVRALISVEALAKGFDVPDVGCVCDCRPLRKSLSTFVQMLGRGLRASPGKRECLLLDFSGNIIRMRDDFADLYFNGLAELDAGERLDAEPRKDFEEKEIKACPSCGFSPCGKKCVRCGFEKVRVSLTEHEAGVARELDILGTGRKAYAKNLVELWAMVVTHEKQRSARRVQDGRDPGKPAGAAWHRFKELTGKAPPKSFDFNSAPRIEPSAALLGKLRSLQIAFVKGRARPPTTTPAMLEGFRAKSREAK